MVTGHFVHGLIDESKPKEGLRLRSFLNSRKIVHEHKTIPLFVCLRGGVVQLLIRMLTNWQNPSLQNISNTVVS